MALAASGISSAGGSGAGEGAMGSALGSGSKINVQGGMSGSFAKQTQFLTKMQKRFMRGELIPYLEELLGNVSSFGETPRYSKFKPGFDEGSLGAMSLAGLERMAMGESGGVGGFDDIREVINSIMGRGPQDFEEFYKTNVRDPLMEMMLEDVVPATKASAVGSGNLFSSRHNELQSKAWEEAIASLGRERAALALDYETLNRQDQLAALQMLPGMETAEYDILANMLGAERAQQIYEYEARVNREQAMRDEEFRRTQFAAELATQLATAQTTARSSKTRNAGWMAGYG